MQHGSKNIDSNRFAAEPLIHHGSGKLQRPGTRPGPVRRHCYAWMAGEDGSWFEPKPRDSNDVAISS